MCQQGPKSSLEKQEHMRQKQPTHFGLFHQKFRLNATTKQMQKLNQLQIKGNKSQHAQICTYKSPKIRQTEPL